MQDRGEYLDHLLEHVAESGVTVQHITGDHTHPSYSHTVGLTALRLPELSVSGLPPTLAGPLLNRVGHEIAWHGTRPELGRCDLPYWPQPFWFLGMYRARRRLWTVVGIYGPNVTGWQLVWPDADDRFPWDDGYTDGEQPLFGRAPRGR